MEKIKQVQIWVNAHDRAYIKAEAAKLGITISEFVSMLCLKNKEMNEK